MGKGRAVAKLAALGAAIGGAVFFWRKSHPPADAGTPPTAGQFPPAADTK